MNKKTILAIISLLVGSFTSTALAHPVEFIFEDNLNGTFTFSAMTIVHGSPASGATGFLFNGNAVGYDTEYAITDPVWDAKRAAATGAAPADGWGNFDLFTAALVLDVTLSSATLASYGVTVGNSFVIDTYDNNARWQSGNIAHMTFAQHATPDSGSTLALLGLTLVGIVGIKRRKN